MWASRKVTGLFGLVRVWGDQMSMWFATYLKEREGLETFNCNHGFATYKIENATIYLKDFFVAPYQRHQGLGYKIAQEVIEIGKKAGCNKLLGSLCPLDKNFAENKAMLLKFGMTFLDSMDGLEFYIKEI